MVPLLLVVNVGNQKMLWVRFGTLFSKTGGNNKQGGRMKTQGFDVSIDRK